MNRLGDLERKIVVLRDAEDPPLTGPEVVTS
jgi:hypothetical protein